MEIGEVEKVIEVKPQAVPLTPVAPVEPNPRAPVEEPEPVEVA